MASDLTGIFNEALSIAGGRVSISLPEENSREAELCRLWFPTIRDMVQRAAPWPSNKAFRRLAVVSMSEGQVWDEGMPEPGFRYAYETPSDMLAPRYLTNFERFTVSIDAHGNKIINTNSANAILCYSRRNEQIPSWDTSVSLAITHALGAAITMPLTGRRGAAAEALEFANQKIAEARQLEQNLGEGTLESVPDWIAARGYAGGYTQVRYMYPETPLLTLGGLGNAG